MSKPLSLPLYGFTVCTMTVDGLHQEDGAIAASYFQESGAYTVFKDPEHMVVEAYRTDLVTRIIRTEKPVRV